MIGTNDQWRRQFENPRRRHQRKLSLEMIMRKSIGQNFREYVDNCSLGGVRKMFEPGISVFQRFIWIAVFVTGVAAATYYLMYTWSGSLSKPLIVTMDTPTYPISMVEFPAVAVCSINRISKKAVTDFTKEMYSTEKWRKTNMTLVAWQMAHIWGNLIEYTYSQILETNPVFHDLAELYRGEDAEDVVNIMERLAPNCSELLVRCAWGGEIVDCKKMFKVRRTTRGHCCTFNFVLSHRSGGSRHRLSRLTDDIKRQHEATYLYGLALVLDPKLNDYAYTTSAVQGFDILLFSPTMFPDPRAGRVIQRLVEPNRAVFLELNSVKQVATREVHKYSASVRNCYFFNDNKEIYNNMYSYSVCIIMCRIRTMQSLCKCTPYFLAQFRLKNSGPVCTIEDLKCLNKYKGKFNYLYPAGSKNVPSLEMEVQDSLFCPECLPDCELTKYYTQFYETPLSTRDYRQKDSKSIFVEDLNVTDKCLMFVYYPTPDTILDRLDVVSYWYEIMSNVGGFSGIILGFSLITAIEIIYHVFIRFFIIFYANYIKYQ